jgi:hypothetical protein
MIIYGRRSTKVATGHVSSTCHCCQQQEQQTFQISNEYIHIYWIPFCPVSTTYAVYCPFCRNVFKGNQIPGALLHQLKETAATTKRPLWHWAGLFIIAGLVLYSLIF